MGAVATARKPNQLGGLEVVKRDFGDWAVREVGSDDRLRRYYALPLRRHALALRQMLVDAAGGDWAGLPRNDDQSIDVGALDASTRARITRVVEIVRDAETRRSWRLCLLCGGLPESSCSCGQPVRSHDPRRWTAEDMAWVL